MSDTPTDPREEKPSDERQTMLRRLRELESQLFPLQRERDQLAADLKNALDGQEYYKNEADVAAERLAKLAAEVERLKTACEKEFQSVEQLSGENIKLAAEIAELKALLSFYHFDTSNPPAVVKAIIEGNIKDRAELETAKLTLFQTEKRLDDKLRAALAELEAARKEVEVARRSVNAMGGIADRHLEEALKVAHQRDTALAAKDAAEKRVADLELLIRKAPHAFTCASKYYIGGPITSHCDCWKSLAALTPAPTQEPPAGKDYVQSGHEYATMEQSEDAQWDRERFSPPAGGVTISNDSVNSETQLGPKGHVTAEGANSGQSADPGAVTISTEKKGGDEPCASQIVPSVSNSKPSNVLKTGPIGASNSPADVPSEGRGECPMCRNTRFIGISPGVDEPCRVCAFSLSDALAGKPVVQRDGRPVTEITTDNELYPVRGIVDGKVRRWAATGKYYYGDSDAEARDLFMLPTEGSGA